MKRFFSLFLTTALAGAGFVSCSDDPEDQPVVPTDVEKVSGIETNYVLGLHEYLEITPDIELSNENESISYEWSIDYETVSTERNLSFKCDELLNDVNCYFKASSSTGAKIAEFKLSVTSPYDKGLLLLSQTGDGAMLTFKRLDIMATPASPYAFKDNNPTLSLGKEALALCWKGEGLTNLGNSIKDQDTEIILSSGNPTKVYVLNTNDMKVKTEITYNGEGEFHPNYVIYPYGVQNSLWEGELYWLGGGREYIMAADRNFITSTMEEMPHHGRDARRRTVRRYGLLAGRHRHDARVLQHGQSEDGLHIGRIGHGDRRDESLQRRTDEPDPLRRHLPRRGGRRSPEITATNP